jgi:hypothetical protein
MSSIISTLSGNFGKSLILGTLLPVTAFVILSAQLLQPFIAHIELQAVDFAFLEEFQSDLLVLSLIIVFISSILYFLNTQLIRVYEGYPWKDTWFGRFLISIQSKRYAHIISRAKGYRALIYALGNSDPKVFAHWNKYMKTQSREFLMSKGDILPTRLGNLIRSFEKYPKNQYGIDAVSLWSPLVGVMDQKYLAALDDAKISFDFMINNSFLSFLLVTALFGGAILFPSALDSPSVLITWSVQISVFLLLAWIFYLLSLDKAIAWGSLVRSAFDIYRLVLLNQLGYNQKVVNREEERMLWELISNQLTYGDGPAGPYPPYSWGASDSYVFGEPQSAKLEITRGLVPLWGAKFEVTVQIRNTDPAGRMVQKILVSDAIPENYAYHWDSAKINGQKTTPISFNPIQFRIQSLEPNSVVTISYYMVKI